MPHQKSAMTLGLEKILNNPETSFLKNPTVFRQIMTSANQPITASLRHIGLSARASGKPKPPTDEERSKARLQQMENGEK